MSNVMKIYNFEPIDKIMHIVGLCDRDMVEFLAEYCQYKIREEIGDSDNLDGTIIGGLLAIIELEWNTRDCLEFIDKSCRDILLDYYYDEISIGLADDD